MKIKIMGQISCIFTFNGVQAKKDISPWKICMCVFLLGKARSHVFMFCSYCYPYRKSKLNVVVLYDLPWLFARPNGYMTGCL